MIDEKRELRRAAFVERKVNFQTITREQPWFFWRTFRCFPWKINIDVVKMSAHIKNLKTRKDADIDLAEIS